MFKVSVDSGNQTDVDGPCYHLRPWWYLGPGCNHGGVQVQAATKGLVWVQDPVIAKFWVDVHDLCVVIACLYK